MKYMLIMRATDEAYAAFQDVDFDKVLESMGRFNDEMISELREWATATASDPGVRVVVVRGAGPAFCAGADLAWMAKTIDYTQAQNVEDASRTSGM